MNLSDRSRETPAASISTCFDLSISIHGHALRPSGQLTFGSRADWPAPCHAARSAAFLECQQLLRSECLVVNLTGSFDQILQVGAKEEIAQVDEIRMSLVLHVDCSPSVLPCRHLPAVDHTGAFTPDHGERGEFLDGGIGGSFLLIQVLVIIGVHSEIVELKLLSNPLFESSAFLGCQRIGLCDDWHDVDNIGQLLQDYDVNGFEAMA